jgi:ABC-type cobalamin/Fe3+-siderophores transport system ATPase subunit
MIELLGIGMTSGRGEWLFRRLSARVERPELIAVVAPDREARLALLDAVAARRLPPEGRVWVNSHPLTKQTRASYRCRVVEVDVHAELHERRSLLANVRLGPRHGLPLLERWRRRLSAGSRLAAEHATIRSGLERMANEPMRALAPAVRRRALVAHALTWKPDVLVVREIERDLSLSDAARNSSRIVILMPYAGDIVVP